MIKAKELMIGNFIQIDANQFDEVISIDDESGIIRVKTGNEYYLTSSFINGIPLTPEWLERCGFNWEDSYLKIDLNNARMKLGFAAGVRDKMTLFQASCPGDGSIVTTMHFGWNHPEYVH